MKTILTRIIEERDRLIQSGEVPDSLFLSKESRDRLIAQAAIAYDVQADSLRKEFLKMQIYPAAQYRGETFRIYCKPRFDRNKPNGV